MAKIVQNLSSATMTDRGLAFHRTNAWPIDGSTLFYSLLSAQNYAKGMKVNENQDGEVAYVGQQLFVINEELSTVDEYVIQNISGDLEKTATHSEIAALSNAISSKIWIEDRTEINGISAHSDLSVIKIKKDDFDKHVAANSGAMSSNVMYVVESEYIDAYGQALSNLVMSSDGLPTSAYFPSEATNKNYVDALCSSLCIEISAEKETRLSTDNIIQQKTSELSNKTLSLELSADGISSHVKNIESELSNAISSKIWIEDRVNGISANTDLSIIKISKDEYDISVATDKLDKLSNALFVVSAEYLDAYGQQLCNLTMSDNEESSYEGIAATKTYVDAMISSTAVNKSDISSTLSTVVEIPYIGDASDAESMMSAINMLRQCVSSLYILMSQK